MNQEIVNKKLSRYGAACQSSFDTDTTINMMDGFKDGYTEGYSDAMKMREVPSIEMIKRILELDEEYDTQLDVERWNFTQRAEYIQSKLFEA